MDLPDLKVLIVEDQPEARRMLREVLEQQFGILQIFESPHGEDALQFMESSLDFIDIVICDWNMPEMSGLDLLRKVRAIAPEMPFLMVTGRGDLDSVVEAKSSGVTGYIRKPFSCEQLEAKLRIIMQRKAAA